MRITGQFLRALGEHQGEDRNGGFLIEMVSTGLLAKTGVAELSSSKGSKGVPSTRLP
jgi:hypothetical protein